MHQRSCRVILELNSELLKDMFTETEVDNDSVEHVEIQESDEHDEYFVLRKGINLPKTNSEWLTANEYFKFSILSNPPIKGQYLNAQLTF